VCSSDLLLILEENAARRDISWRLGLGEDIVQPNKRLCEIANWIERQVRPRAAR
jgi:hypothetical protein